MTIDSGALFSDLIRFETELWNVVAARLKSEHRLELSWFEPMHVIANESDCRVQEISETLSITVGGASKLVDKIEAAGFCRRRENPGDRRSSNLELTPKGKRLLAAAERTFAAEVERWLRTPLSPLRFHEFGATIRQLRQVLRGSEPLHRWQATSMRSS